MKRERESVDMANLEELENVQLLLSHRKTYHVSRSADEILADKVNVNLLFLLSVLSFRHKEEVNFRNWSLYNIYNNNEQRERARSAAIFSRRTLWLFWKVVLKASSLGISTVRNDSETLKVLHEAFSANNDVDDYEEDDTNQYFIKLSVSNYRDNVLRKLYRSQMIFLTNDLMKPHTNKFEAETGISVELYINFIYRIISKFYQYRSANASLDSVGSRWGINLENESIETGIPVSALSTLMKFISFSVQEGAAFSASTESDVNDFSLFRNKPFIKISDTYYLPVEGKLVEELLFESLFHKIYEVGGKNPRYLTDFGNAFEAYAQNLTELFCSAQQGQIYRNIPEFTYGKPQAKSPDLFIKSESDKSILAVEVKSARYLDAVVSTNNNPQAVEESFNKLINKPLLQAAKSVQTIIAKRASSDITADYRYLYVCVTMNDIPISMQDTKFKNNENDNSWMFYAFNIETFELLLAVGADWNDHTLYDILRSLHLVRNRMSIKTALSRSFGHIVEQGRFLSLIQDAAFKKHLNWFAKIKAA